MNTLIIVAIVAFVIVAALLVALKAMAAAGRGESDGKSRASDYVLLPAVLTPAERSFLGVLETALPPDVGYLAKIRLGDVFTTAKGLTASERTTARNRIDRKHVDFLLIRTTDLKPLAGIELDDRSHDAEDRKKRDAFVDGVFQSAGLPLLHIPARATYDPRELQTSITSLLTPNGARRRIDRDSATRPVSTGAGRTEIGGNLTRNGGSRVNELWRGTSKGSRQAFGRLPLPC